MKPSIIDMLEDAIVCGYEFSSPKDPEIIKAVLSSYEQAKNKNEEIKFFDELDKETYSFNFNVRAKERCKEHFKAMCFCIILSAFLIIAVFCIANIESVGMGMPAFMSTVLMILLKIAILLLMVPFSIMVLFSCAFFRAIKEEKKLYREESDIFKSLKMYKSDGVYIKR